MAEANPPEKTEFDVDTTNHSRGLWLLKVGLSRLLFIEYLFRYKTEIPFYRVFNYLSLCPHGELLTEGKSINRRYEPNFNVNPVTV